MKDNRLEQRIQHSLNAELSGLNTTSWQRNQFFENATGGHKVKRKLTAAMVFAAVLIIATMGVAFALTNGFGILDFARNSIPNAEIPENAAQYIEHDQTVVETEHFIVCYRETSYDGKTCHVVYDVIPESKDLLLFDKPLDEYWYGQTQLNPDRLKMVEDGRTILDRWDEGGYTSGWEVEIDVGSETENIQTYSTEGVLDEETGIYTGKLSVTFESIKEERTLWFSVRMLPLSDMHDENSEDYSHAEYGYMEKTFHAAVSGEEVILVNTSPILFSQIGIQVDQIKLMVLPQEIQYQIDYSLINHDLYHSLFDEHPDEDHIITVPPAFRFITAEQGNDKIVILPRGISDNFIGYDIDEEKGLYRQTGSLGRSCFADTYKLGAFRDAYADFPIPIETETFQVDVQNPDTFTPEERVWQQESDKSKEHNEANDTLVNPEVGDLSAATAVSIAKAAILEAYSLPIDALDNAQVIIDLYVTNNRPDYRRWMVRFVIRRADNWLEREYSCIVDSNGVVIEDPDINEPSLHYKAQQWKDDDEIISTYRQFSSLNEYKPFWMWPYEAKANCSNRLKKILVTSDDQSYHPDIVTCLKYSFLLPDDSHIQYSNALEIARTSISEKYKVGDSVADMLQVKYESYVKLVDGEMWIFVLSGGDDYDSLHYFVKLNGSTGSIISCDEVKWFEIYDEDMDNLFFLE